MNMKLRYPNGMTGRLHLCPIMISCQNTVRESWYVNRKRDLAATQGAIFAKIWARNAGLDIRDSNDRSSGYGIVVTERAEMQDLDSPFQDFPTLKRYPNLRLNLRSKLKKRRGRERERKAPKRNGRGRPLPSPPNPPPFFPPLQSSAHFDACYAGYSLSAQWTTAKSFVSLSNLWEVSGLM